MTLGFRLIKSMCPSCFLPHAEFTCFEDFERSRGDPQDFRVYGSSHLAVGIHTACEYIRRCALHGYDCVVAAKSYVHHVVSSNVFDQVWAFFAHRDRPDAKLYRLGVQGVQECGQKVFGFRV